MNIKNEEAHRLALEISKRTGETITATVIRALKLLQAQEQARPKTPEEKRAAWEAIKREYPVKHPIEDVGDDFIYDPETGLPW